MTNYLFLKKKSKIRNKEEFHIRKEDNKKSTELHLSVVCWQNISIDIQHSFSKKKKESSFYILFVLLLYLLKIKQYNNAIFLFKEYIKRIFGYKFYDFSHLHL